MNQSLQSSLFSQAKSLLQSVLSNKIAVRLSENGSQVTIEFEL